MESATRFHQPFRDYEEPFDISALHITYEYNSTSSFRKMDTFTFIVNGLSHHHHHHHHHQYHYHHHYHATKKYSSTGTTDIFFMRLIQSGTVPSSAADDVADVAVVSVLHMETASLVC
ncbi:hypothetical protein PV328_008049 [Microctonus aethiopoides]|uniref:Uncharacterized protein n=1 Tax=Microctonus aethiopoides TaxID=144406 RepID=A0AA39F1L3_9HYME|nr:hypothetical protein PV328_008049 [Microctonus aethiopoides]